MTSAVPGVPVLAGLDAVAWDLFEHAYGPATDVPELLRALVCGDDDQAAEAAQEIAQEALYELYGNIWHQGSVYPATVPAVPFLVEIAVSGAAGALTAEVLQLLGSIAESSDPRGIEDPDAVRSAVAACTESLVPLLDAPEGATRAAALFVLVHGASAERVCPLILERWNAEAEAGLRAEALHAMIRVDAQAAADLADEVLSARVQEGAGVAHDAVLGVSCALAWIHAGRAVDERVLSAALAPIPDESRLQHWSRDVDLFDLFTDELAERQGPDAAVALVARALEDGRCLSAARQLIVGYRSASGPLAEPIARLLDQPEFARGAVGLLELLGPSAAARDRLVALARADEAGLADDALACLACWNDPIVPGLLARALGNRPRTLNATTVVPFDQDLLNAIRRRLSEICDAAQQPPAADDSLFALVRDRNEPIQLAGILASWGEPAQDAVPELCGLLAASPVAAAKALAAIRPESPECVAALRRAAQATTFEDGAVRARIEVARAIRTLTGDAGPLLEAARFGLTTESKSPDDRSMAAEAAADLPEHADLLVPLLLEALQAIPIPTPSLPAHQARMQVGRALWQLTGEPEHLVDVLRSTLGLAGESLTGWTVATAADLAAELGPAARALVAGLEAALADSASRPAAARALLIVDPEGSQESIVAVAPLVQ